MSPVVNNGDTTYQYLKEPQYKQSFSKFMVWYNSMPKMVVQRNVGKSFRYAFAKELRQTPSKLSQFQLRFCNRLSPEMLSADAGFEYNSTKFVIGVSPFLNYFSNYIYLNPSSEHDRLYGNGNQVYYYTQCEVFRYGTEIHAHYQLLKPLQVGISGEYVYSEQLSGEKKRFTLPFSPPASVILNAKYQKQRIQFVENAYLFVDYKLAAPQNNIVPPEETTEGYQVINMGLGGDVKLRNQKLTISLQVQNLLNTKYFNHTSYYRLINVPEPGRNFIVNISIPFSGELKINTINL